MCRPKTLKDAYKMLQKETEQTARKHYGLKGEVGEEEADEELSRDEIIHLQGREEGLQWAAELIAKVKGSWLKTESR